MSHQQGAGQSLAGQSLHGTNAHWFGCRANSHHMPKYYGNAIQSGNNRSTQQRGEVTLQLPLTALPLPPVLISDPSRPNETELERQKYRKSIQLRNKMFPKRGRHGEKLQLLVNC